MDHHGCCGCDRRRAVFRRHQLLHLLVFILILPYCKTEIEHNKAVDAGAGALQGATPEPDEPAPDDAPEDPADEDDDDSDNAAPFMIVIEHTSLGRFRCAGTLVSIKTGVTSASCARGRGLTASRELWALSVAAAVGQCPRGDGARRVAQLALAGPAPEPNLGLEPGAKEWGGVVLDLAVLVLESPFASAAKARPILMATEAGECGGAGATCSITQALPVADSAKSRLRIVNVVVTREDTCKAAARYWAAVREQALCLTGAVLCPADWGAGVLCAGKLCGVVSRSVGPPPDRPEPPQALELSHGAPQGSCGDTHAAQSVARWRSFLHCAHALRSCGRGECADLCNEKQLIEDNTTLLDNVRGGGGGGGAGKAKSTTAGREDKPSRGHFSLITVVDSDEETEATASTKQHPNNKKAKSKTGSKKRAGKVGRMMSTRGQWRGASEKASDVKPTRTSPIGDQTQDASPRSANGHSLFDPNRPDFRAGEYGDNLSEYVQAGDDPPAPPTRSPPPTKAAPPQRHLTAARRVAPPPTSAPTDKPTQRGSYHRQCIERVFGVLLLYFVL